MHIAVDTVTDRVVAGPDVTAAQPPVDPDRYECLFCNARLAYNPTDGTTFDYFTHESAPTCLSAGSSSKYHRVGQELISKKTCNQLPVSPRDISIDVETYVGSPSGYRVADVLIERPVKVVIEVVYQTSVVNLRDRLATAFEDGYTGMVAVLQNADVSAARVERHLSRVGAIEVATIDPHRGTVEIGSVIRPETVTLERDAWAAVPSYLA